MASKRKRRASPVPKGLAAGEQLQRSTLTGSDSSAWGWVGTEVLDASEITQEHRLIACGLSKRNRYPICPNKYAPTDKQKASPRDEVTLPSVDGELDDDVIVISDDEPQQCSKKICKNNPNCLNYLGQEKWEDEDKSRRAFLKALNTGDDPILDSRDPDIPVGLKNLGATCYANAFLQVWFRDLEFRNGVYQCQPPQNSSHKYEDSPVFQLQVTFAALQESTQNVFNPSKLVESLKLRTTEQQDAQEFSKLFMSHLDAEFRKQSIPSLKSLIPDKFQGKQVYGTICDNCHNRSERLSDFLEIEINFDNNSKLEDCIADLLQPEKLTGDNKYLCGKCDNLQDATRYSELRQLPPVLHFSLLRFVYDFSTMERKKSKNAILFPTVLDMDQFLGSVASRKAAVNGKSAGENIYELRGVLLHKGSSAYHGHYEAQVYDRTNESWFQFDDETVTKIKNLGDKRSTLKPVINVDDDDDDSAKDRKRQFKNARKKMRVDSDDEDAVEVLDSTQTNGNGVNESHSQKISSKDAYMLVYTRKELSAQCNGTPDQQRSSPSIASGRQAQIEIPTPPSRVLEVVNSLNAAHDEACDAFSSKEKETKLRFEALRRKMMHIYRSWSINNHTEDSVIVSQNALETWFSRYLVKASSSSEKMSTTFELDRFPSPHTATISEILCSHDCLDPGKAHNMKRISQVAYEMMKTDTYFSITPSLTPDAVCEQCTKESFIERLYQTNHPKIVTRFQEVDEVLEDSMGYWISKQWLKDWRLSKPKMHTAGEPDPAPDSSEFNGHAQCEHGSLALNTTSRRRISVAGFQILKELFPDWEPLSTNAELCPICEALVHMSKEGKREIRQRAEEERAKLKHMHDNALTGSTLDLENVPCAILPAQFVRSWRRWLLRPAAIPRPAMVDNTHFICEHGKLVFDPNSPGDLNITIAMVKRSDWDILEDLYSGGPLIAVEKRRVRNNDDHFESKYIHDIPTCADCRHERKSNYETTVITVRILRTHDPNPTPSTYSTLNESAYETERKSPALKLANLKGGVTRQSTRIREVKEKIGKRKVTISKESTVKDIKLKLYDELSIPTVYQRLYYRGHELEDNSVTAASLGILADDLLDLREEKEIDVDLTDSDNAPAKKKRREEGMGFGGTVLGGSSRPGSCSSVDATEMGIDQQTDQSIVHSPLDAIRTCTACTYANVLDASVCEICDTPFD